MDGFQREIEEIVKSCAEDEELRRIVFEINKMDPIQRKDFSKKVDVYFLSKNSVSDIHAYNFFKLLLDDKIRSAVTHRLKGR